MAVLEQHRILVTGGAGFVGGWLETVLSPRLGTRDRLVLAGPHGRSPDQDVEAVTLDLLDRASQDVEAVTLDLLDRASVAAIVRDVRPTHVLHLAAVADVQNARASPRMTWDVNLGGTFTLAEAVMHHSPGANFIYVSTSEVYGDQFNLTSTALDESARLEPTNPYAASKAAADLLIGQLARDGLHAIRVRPFNHTGPRQSRRYVVPAFAAQIAAIEQGKQAPVIGVGNLEARRDFLDVRDVVHAYIELITRAPDLQPGLVLNLASGIPRRIGDILDQLLAFATVPITVSPDSGRIRANDTPIAVGDARRAKDILGWQPQLPWEKTLGDVLNYWREQCHG